MTLRRAWSRARPPAWLVLAVLPACSRDVDALDTRTDDDALASIRYDDGTHVRVLSMQPDPVTPPGPLTVVLEVVGPDDVALEVALWPPRTGGRELALGSGVDAVAAARPDDPRVTRASITGSGSHTVLLPLPSEWSPRTAMVTVGRPDGALATGGPRTRDGLGTAGLVDVVLSPRRLVATRFADAPVLDGILDEPVWSTAQPIALADSLEGEVPTQDADVRIGWNEDTLFVGVTLVDADVWSEYQTQDDPVWKEEVFELFLFGDASRRRYLELQVSPRGVTFDARFATYRKGDEAWDGAWTAAAHVDGTVGRRDDRDRGWSAELALPLAMICEHTTTTCPMTTGSTTRINAFWIDRPKRGQPGAWSIAPTRVTDFHAPEAAAILELGP